MKQQTLLTGSIIAVGIVIVAICVGMVSGYPFFRPFISVDPVSDKNVGDQFAITGTTDLAAGTEIVVEVYPSVFETEEGRNGSGEFSGAAGIETVVLGTGNANAWSFSLDTASLKPTEYVVRASVLKGDPTKGDYSTGDVYTETTFTLREGAAVSGQYIRVDSIPDKTTGDLLVVTGTTNLPGGTVVMVTAGGNDRGYGGNAMVRNGTAGVNTFTSSIDTSVLNPGTITVTVTVMEGDPSGGDYAMGTTSGTVTFVLRGRSLIADTPVQATVTEDDYISIDAIGDHSVGDQFLITGTTSLPAGVEMIWQIMPDTGKAPSGIDLNVTGILANSVVTKGDGTVNRISLAVDTTGMSPGQYVVIAGEMKGDAATGDFGTGDLAGSAVLNLK